MVLILADEFDVHTDVVVEKLINRHISYYRLNLDVESLKKTFVTFNGCYWKITTPSGSIISTDVTCVWCRRAFVELTLQEKQIESTDFSIWKNEWNKTFIGLYNSLKDIPWLNPLRKAYKGENKYYQMALAKAIGFEIPETIVSNNKEELKNFICRYNGAILKLMSQEIYCDNGEYKGFYTNRIGEKDIENFSNIGENPIVLQNYIEKAYEVRYTVVGEKHFVCRIDSQHSGIAKEDWRRYDIPHTPHIIITPPEDIRSKVNILLDKLALEFGALDFIVSPDGSWIFLEINCMGQWLWIEQLTGLPISDAIVDWINQNK